jgi:hypothetical protein
MNPGAKRRCTRSNNSHASFLFMAIVRLPKRVCQKKRPVKIRFLTIRQRERSGGLATGEYQIDSAVREQKI